MPKIIITRPTRADGKSLEPSDKPVEVSKAAAHVLLSAGKARAPAKGSKSVPPKAAE